MAPDNTNIIPLYDKYECGKVYDCTKRGVFKTPDVTNAIRVVPINSIESKKVHK